MTDPRQIQASDPQRSVFVSANAGTGKTKVLIERVLRLLLSDITPDSILCVTFTNAAAAEIEERLNQKLASWAIMSSQDLQDDMRAMTGGQPTQDMLLRARRLFAEVIDNDQGPKVETTHSFCQSLLSRFPVEAGVPPHFKLVSDAQKQSLLKECYSALFTDPSQTVQQALSDLIGLTDSQTLFTYITSFIDFRPLSDAAIAMPLGFVPAFEEEMQQISPYHLGELAELTLSMVDQLHHYPLKMLFEARADKCEPLGRWLALPDKEAQAEALHWVIGLFTTQKATPKSVFVKAQLTEQPELAEYQARISEILCQYMKEKTALLTVHRSRALYRVGQAVAISYEQAKNRAGLLDYDDLIIKADRLLSSAEMRAWVRWKLDHGITHILVDEAQDTNPAQWQLLSSLAEEFFAEEAEEGAHRTLFSVGDFKQSIYSFQGANPHIFLQKGSEFEAQAKRSLHHFDKVTLARSYRSSKAILDFVNHVLDQEAVSGLGGAFDTHEAAFLDKFGHVGLWPLSDAVSGDDDPPYIAVPTPIEQAPQSEAGADALLAERIAGHMAQLIAGTAKDVPGRRYEPRDMMVLVRKRDRFFALLRGALIRHNIPVSGADRLYLSRQIEISDLLALGDVCLLQEDDLQLAALLKSPLFGLSEDEVMSLAMRRPAGQSLFAALKVKAGSDSIYSQAGAQLETYLSLSTSLGPAAFFEVVLAKGGRDAFYRRLGTGVDESFNAFIRQAYDFEAEGGVGLSAFLAHSRTYGGEIKRDLGNMTENEVRILTIHGAKGLQAPVVYLPDTIAGMDPPDPLVKSKSALFWPDDSALLPPVIAEQKDAMAEERAAEQQRLLYVALTRAAECLFITGWNKKRSKKQADNWYELCQRGMTSLGAVADADGGYTLTHQGATATALSGLTQADDRPVIDVEAAYPWAFSQPPEEEQPVRPLVPSQPPEKQQPQSVATTSGQLARQEGIFVHYLLDIVGGLPAESRADGLERVARQASAQFPLMVEERRLSLASHLVRFMAQAEFAPLFSDKALSEFQISGVVGTKTVIGQIDKVVLDDDVIWLVDFKSGRPQGHNPPASYVTQMALYHALLSQIYPDRLVRASLIWVQDFAVTDISAEQMTDALATLSHSD